MAYQVLARKYRPQNFSEVIGQDHVTRTLRNAIEGQRIAHGYIFSGHRGIGKTTIARILAMCLNCRKGDKPTPEPCGVCESCTEVRAGNAVDVIEIDAATNRGIDEIRELREAARYRPARDRYKIYILDEAHQITDAAFNALLKTLEEPPAHIVFMMATTQPEDIPQTIRSRCQHFSFHAVKFDDIVGQLRAIAQKEGIEVEEEAIAALAEAGDGSMRDALSIMDQAIACCGEGKLTASLVRGLVGTVSSDVLESLMSAVAADSPQDALGIVDRLVTEGQSPSHLMRQLVRFLRNATVAKISGRDSSLLQISSDERQRVARTAEAFSEEDLARFLQIALRTYDELGYRQEQRFHLELGILKMVHASRLLPLEELLSDQPVTTKPTSSPSSGASRPAPRVERVASSSPSPFESSRNKPRMEASGAEPATARAASPLAATVIAAAAVALAESQAKQPETAPTDGPDADTLRAAILASLEDAGQGVLAQMLEAGDWSFATANELVIKVAKSEVMIEMSFGAEPRKLVNAAATQAAGRPVKVRLVSGGPANGAAAGQQHRGTVRASGGGGSARNRAANDPLVQYIQEKFGGEIRTVIDQTPENK
jgi:DNA polymerase-3 subunit gamma/tau